MLRWPIQASLMFQRLQGKKSQWQKKRTAENSTHYFESSPHLCGHTVQWALCVIKQNFPCQLYQDFKICLISLTLPHTLPVFQFFCQICLIFLILQHTLLVFQLGFFFFLTLKPLMRDHLSFKTTYFKTFQFLFILPCERIPHQGSSLF